MKKSLTAIVLGLSVAAGASISATAQAQTTPIAARPTAPANATYQVWYQVLKTGKTYLYMTTTNYASAIRAMHYLNEDPKVYAWYQRK